MNYNFKDRTGEFYGTLEVLQRAPDAIFPSGKLVQWECKCHNCQKIVTVIGSNLSKMKSCGCLNYKKVEDLTGKQFGLLTVVKRAPNHILPSGQQQVCWICKCICGTEKTIRAAHLKNNSIRSCGCIKSFGERKIAELLNFYNIKFKKEFSFSNLINSKGNLLKFDFALFNFENKLLGLLEYQGEQHYRKNIPFGKMQREETDFLKKQYCKNNNIPFFEIRYDENLEEKLKEFLTILYDNTVLSVK